MKKVLFTILSMVLLFCVGGSYAQNPVIGGSYDKKQQYAELGDFGLESGQKILDCKIGYRTFGKLNEDKSNAMIFLCGHTMTSAILQMFIPGMIADTTKYQVILIDALANGVSSSPSNSKKQAGLKFPKITLLDMVNTQHELLTQKMGINHVKAVWGVSMGALQTYQWITAYPDFMDKALPYAGTPRMAGYDLLWGTTYLRAIQMDPAYNEGRYKKNPVLALAPHVGQMVWTSPESVCKKVPASKFEEFYRKAEETNFDWNDAVRQIEAVMVHDITKNYNGSLEETAKSVKCQVLAINIKQDHAVNPILSESFVPMIEKGQYKEIDAVDGHTTPLMPFKEMREFLNN